MAYRPRQQKNTRTASRKDTKVTDSPVTPSSLMTDTPRGVSA